jgi:hypothetical protein
VSGFRGAGQIEGVLDQAIEQMKQAAQQPQAAAPPDPKLLQMQLKGQQEMQKIEAKHATDMARIQAETEADRQREANQAYHNIQEAAVKQQIAGANRAARPNGGRPGSGGPV